LQSLDDLGPQHVQLMTFDLMDVTGEHLIDQIVVAAVDIVLAVFLESELHAPVQLVPFFVQPRFRVFAHAEISFLNRYTRMINCATHYFFERGSGSLKPGGGRRLFS
jgi:hypothetical protein